MTREGKVMSNNITKQSGYHGLLAANSLTNVKHFEGLFIQIAVSENGYIAIYYPYEPEIQKGLRRAFSPEKQERLELIHISQINSFDIECVDSTKVSGGSGGAVAGALIGGMFGFSGAGAVIGSSASRGKVTQNITDITLVLNTKNFNNPRVEVLLYKREPTATEMDKLRRHHHKNYTDYFPYGLREYYDYKKLCLNKDGKKLAEKVYNGKPGFIALKYEPNFAQIEELGSTLTQMLTTQQQSEAAAVSAPQISSADELAKFKSLLDSGVITQDEFDAKKKQLLGL